MELDGGRIVIDGQDIAKMGLHQLRSSMSLIPQVPTPPPLTRPSLALTYLTEIKLLPRKMPRWAGLAAVLDVT
jgi:hypothetical protein